MEQRREAELQEVDVASMGVLLGVVAAAFVTLGVIIYFFGEDQSSAMSAANNPPAQTERMMRSKSATPGTIGQGGNSR
jgi:hypothetical protein